MKPKERIYTRSKKTMYGKFEDHPRPTCGSSSSVFNDAKAITQEEAGAVYRGLVRPANLYFIMQYSRNRNRILTHSTRCVHWEMGTGGEIVGSSKVQKTRKPAVHRCCKSDCQTPHIYHGFQGFPEI